MGEKWCELADTMSSTTATGDPWMVPTATWKYGPTQSLAGKYGPAHQAFSHTTQSLMRVMTLPAKCSLATSTIRRQRRRMGRDPWIKNTLV